MNPTDVLWEAWGIDDVLEPCDIGVNQATWRVGVDLWLSRSGGDANARRRREGQLYDRLNRLAATLPSKSFQFPVVVPTKNDDELFSAAGWTWRLTRHLSGECADPQQENLYPAIANSLGRLHRLLSDLPEQLRVADTNLMDDIRGHLLKARADDDETPMIVRKACKVIMDGLPELSKLDVQLIHGDFSHPNIRLSADGNPRVVGILDFEFCSVDPPLMDLATLASTILLRSESPKPEQLISQTITCYEESIDHWIPRKFVKLAMLARKVDSYYYHSSRSEEGSANSELVQRQIGHLEVIVAYGSSQLG